MKNKTFFKIIAILMVLFLAAACSKTGSGEEEGIETPIETPVETPEEPTPASVTSANACDNIFYPLALDNQWIYRLDVYEVHHEEQTIETSASDLALTVSEVSDSSAVLGALDYDTGIVTKSTVQCQDQAIINFPITELNMVFGNLEGDINVGYVSGKFMPSEEEFEDSDWGQEWETEYIATGNIEADFEGELLAATFSESPVKMRWQVTGRGETLEVDAGTFNDLVKINREISFDISSLKTYVDGNEIELATTLTLNTNMWFAPHIGLVKQEINSASIELFGMNLPVDAWGYFELSDYTVN